MINFKWGMAAAIAAFFVSVILGFFSGVALFHIFIRALIFTAVFFALGFGLRFILNSFFPELLFNEEEVVPQYDFAEPGQRVNIMLDSTGEYAVPELYKISGPDDEMGNIEDLISGTFRPRAQESDGDSGIDRGTEEMYNDYDDYQSTEDVNINFDDVSSPALERPVTEKPAPVKPAVSEPPEEAPKAKQPVFTPSFGDDTGLGSLPDLDLMAMAFSGGGTAPFISAGSGSGSSGAAAPPAAKPAPAAPDSNADFGGLPDIGAGAGAEQAFFQADTFEPMQPVSAYKGNKPQSLKGDFNPKELAEGIRTVLSKDK